MKRDEIKAIFPDATDEQLSKVMSINGEDVEKVKARVTALEAEIKDKKDAFDGLNKELDSLKSSNASAEEWKAKFEALQAENEEKAKKAEADRIIAEKNASISKRFESALGEKKFSHDAIKDAYLKKFSEALDNKDYEGKSDTDIFHALTKDDATAFTGITPIRLAGGNPQGGANNTDEARARAIMGLPASK